MNDNNIVLTEKEFFATSLATDNQPMAEEMNRNCEDEICEIQQLILKRKEDKEEMDNIISSESKEIDNKIVDLEKKMAETNTEIEKIQLK